MFNEKYYSNLLIKQYHDKIKAKSTIEILVKNNIDLFNNIIKNFTENLNIENAKGVWLDILGNYANVSRLANIELEQVEENRPLNYIDDETYRILIKLKIINNYSQNSIKSVDEAIFNYLNNSIIFINNTNMTIDYILLNKDMYKNLIKLIKNNKNILPAPAGVGIEYIVETENKNIFGFSNNDGTTPSFVVGFSNDILPLQQGIYINDNNLI